MTSRQAAITADLRAGLDELSSMAVTALTEHISEAGLCVICGEVWPCALVVLADHNLEAR